MPPTLTYPGVYIEEIPSGVHTITGVPTSIAAFIGWCNQGPVNQATLIESWQDFQTQFGGLNSNSYLGYAVSHFFSTGSQQAYIVRLAWNGALQGGVKNPTAAAIASGTIGGSLTLFANNPGAWGNSLQVAVQVQAGGTNRFTLQVINGTSGKTLETFSNLSTSASDPQYAVTVIDSDSQYLTFVDPIHGVPSSITAPTTTTIAGPTGVTGAAGTTTPGATLPPNTTFYYVVSALYGNSESLPSTTEVSVDNTTTNCNTISWTAAGNFNGAAPTGYKIYRGTSKGGENVFYTAAGNATSYTDTGAPPSVGAPSPSIAGVQLANGADGTTLTPGDGNFENALLNDPNGLGLPLLNRVPIFNLLCVPGESDAATIQALQAFCVNNRAFYIVDCPQLATTSFLTANGPSGTTNNALNSSSNITGQNSINSAYYYPWVLAPDPLAANRPRLFPPCGMIANIYAQTDAGPGVWKAPAGIDATLSGVSGLQYVLTDAENGNLNIQGINCLRQFRVYGDVVWGARTLQGNDQFGSQWKYLSIRRFALFLESSLYDGTQWVVFEPNDENLWAAIRLNITSFMQDLYLQQAFQGTSPAQAYFVKCDSDNNPQSSIDQGVVNILVGFAPLYPAEFVVIQIQQMAGQS
jgi:uncharacterized protein